MLADGRLSLAMVDTKAPGGMQTKVIEQAGPISYVESTTLGIKDIFDEDRTRFVPMSANEGVAQTKAIVRRLAASAVTPQNQEMVEGILRLHHTVQRMLQPLPVSIPYAEDLIRCLPWDRIEVRRSFGHLLSFIEAVALLHQFQREPQGDQLIAARADYEIVRRHLSGPLARSLGCALTSGAAGLLDIVETRECFAVASLAAKSHLSESTVRSRVRELEAAGQVERVIEAQGRRAARYKCVDNPPPLHGLMLPNLTVDPDYEIQAMPCEVVADKT